MNKYVRTKYHGWVDLEVYKEQSVKKIYKILPLKEEGKQWDTYLEGLLIEFSGFDNLVEDISYLSLISKLEGLFSVPQSDLKLFRKIVFDSIDLVKKINHKAEQE